MFVLSLGSSVARPPSQARNFASLTSSFVRFAIIGTEFSPPIHFFLLLSCIFPKIMCFRHRKIRTFVTKKLRRFSKMIKNIERLQYRNLCSGSGCRAGGRWACIGRKIEEKPQAYLAVSGPISAVKNFLPFSAVEFPACKTGPPSQFY